MKRARKPQNMMACITPGYACDSVRTLPSACVATRRGARGSGRAGSPVCPRAELHALPHAVREDGDGEGAADVESDLPPTGTFRTCRETARRAHGRSNDNMGSTAAGRGVRIAAPPPPPRRRSRAPRLRRAVPAADAGTRHQHASSSPRRRSPRRAARAPVCSSAARWRRASASSSAMPTFVLRLHRQHGDPQSMSLRRRSAA